VKAGINALLMPGVKVGGNSLIGPNVVVYRDLPVDTVVLLKQSLEERKLKDS
jgi:acetyltransferase-like isoleucine patch superfamily enzyme